MPVCYSTFKTDDDLALSLWGSELGLEEASDHTEVDDGVFLDFAPWLVVMLLRTLRLWLDVLAMLVLTTNSLKYSLDFVLDDMFSSFL